MRDGRIYDLTLALAFIDRLSARGTFAVIPLRVTDTRFKTAFLAHMFDIFTTFAGINNKMTDIRSKSDF